MARKKPSKKEPLDLTAGSCFKPILLRHLEDGKVYALHFDMKSSTIKAKPFQWKGKQRVLSDIGQIIEEFNLDDYVRKNQRYARETAASDSAPQDVEG